jgi:hypothetical protein
MKKSLVVAVAIAMSVGGASVAGAQECKCDNEPGERTVWPEFVTKVKETTGLGLVGETPNLDRPDRSEIFGLPDVPNVVGLPKVLNFLVTGVDVRD